MHSAPAGLQRQRLRRPVGVHAEDGPGYTDYPLNGETAANQYRSYARKDMQMLVKWATAYVECKSKTWANGNGQPLGLGDMSEANGAIPGMFKNPPDPGHPPGTHTNGFDMDIAYYQVGTPNNYRRSVCEHTSGRADQYHCTKPPHLLDLWRTTLFLGALLTSNTIRVIGVDGQIGPLVEAAMPSLCATGWLPPASCNKVGTWPTKPRTRVRVGIASTTTTCVESLGPFLQFVGVPRHAQVDGHNHSHGCSHGTLRRMPQRLPAVD